MHQVPALRLQFRLLGEPRQDRGAGRGRLQSPQAARSARPGLGGAAAPSCGATCARPGAGLGVLGRRAAVVVVGSSGLRARFGALWASRPGAPRPGQAFGGWGSVPLW